MTQRTCLAIILAAGEGTRMRSAVPKVMHPIAGLPMLGHVLAAAREAGATKIAVVVGPNAEGVRAFLAKTGLDVAVYEQAERLGTGHAVLAARREFAAGLDDVVVLYGDTPLVTPGTIKRLRKGIVRADVVVVGFKPPSPTGYGRLVTRGRQLLAIREERDADADEKAIGRCNAGVIGFSGTVGPALLKKIGNRNAKGEYYLTDLVELANAARKTVTWIEVEPDEVIGVNNRAELAEAERLYQERARLAAMLGGATLIAPETVFFSYDTKLGSDVLIEPGVFFGPGVTIASGATIRAYSHMEGAKVATGAAIGPFARLRPGADIGPRVRVGNFVEVKNGVIDEGAKVNHLTYIGDTHIGAHANIGAGTITSNYDGFDKFHTEIGAGAFIGSSSALVAPVTIGAGAFIGSGSVITEDVPADALAVGRGRQVTKPGWVAKFREKKAAARRKP